MPSLHDDSHNDSEAKGNTMPDPTFEALPSKPRCFVAYPSSPADRAEAIERAIAELNAGSVVDIIGWKSLMVGGRVVISAICDEVKNCQMFIADVTGLNPNVLFELGYAIAHRKRIWLLLNPRIERAKADFDRFQLLTTVGYASYNNSSDIVSQFYREEPYNKLDQNLYDELLRAAGPPSKNDALLYLRCDVNTEASMRIARRVSSGPIPSVIDDPQEVRLQPFTWYVQQVTSAFVIVCHLLSTEYQNWELHNAKHALVAGLAHGLAKPLLMLAHEPYASPLDYRDLLRKHRTAAVAESVFADWSLPHVDQYEKRKAGIATYRAEEKAQMNLRDITIGEPVAEFESDSVPDYYVSTAVYIETLRSKYSLVVGRKGTGKTATLYALTEELRSPEP
jgi:nucleoside 2-deoxyribosyltransferase